MTAETAFPELAVTVFPFPRPLWSVVTGLNDTRKWSRNKIADWVDAFLQEARP